MWKYSNVFGGSIAASAPTNEPEHVMHTSHQVELNSVTSNTTKSVEEVDTMSTMLPPHKLKEAADKQNVQISLQNSICKSEMAPEATADNHCKASDNIGDKPKKLCHCNCEMYVARKCGTVVSSTNDKGTWVLEEDRALVENNPRADRLVNHTSTERPINNIQTLLSSKSKTNASSRKIQTENMDKALENSKSDVYFINKKYNTDNGTTSSQSCV